MKHCTVFPYTGLAYNGLYALLISLTEYGVPLDCSVDWNPSNNYIACGSGDNAISLLLAERDGAGASTLAESSRVEGAHSADVNCVRSALALHTPVQYQTIE